MGARLLAGSRRWDTQVSQFAGGHFLEHGYENPGEGQQGLNGAL